VLYINYRLQYIYHGSIFLFIFYLNCVIDDWKSKTVVGSSFTNTTVEVIIDATNNNVEITFRTTDTNGGTAIWTSY